VICFFSSTFLFFISQNGGTHAAARLFWFCVEPLAAVGVSALFSDFLF
jgi:hypothetical protein